MKGEGDSHPTLSSDQFDDGSEGAGNQKYYENREEGDRVANGANQMVLVARTIVAFILIIAIGAVGLAMNSWISTNEINNFKESFHSDATKIINNIDQTIHETLDAADSFVIDAVSIARETDQEWPYVTIPSFAVKTSKVLQQTKSFSVSMLPVVGPAQVKKWENYTKDHANTWIEESLNIQEELGGNVNRHYSAVDYIYDLDGLPVEEPANLPFYLPSWQSAPLAIADSSELLYNLDTLRNVHVVDSIGQVFQTKKYVVSEFANVIHNTTDDEEVEHKMKYRNWMSRRVDNPEEEALEPTSVMYVPVLHNADKSLDIKKDENIIVAVFSYHFLWKHLVQDVLPPNSHGVAVVFSEECSEGESFAFTYAVSGEEATYLGSGDKHSPRYDNLVKSTILSGEEEDGHCVKKVTVYPSREMEEEYRTNTSSVFIGVSLGIFLFTAALFTIYGE